LPQGFVDSDSDGTRKIKGTQFVGELGNFQSATPPPLVNFRWQTSPFVSKEQTVTILERNIPHRTLGMGGKKMDALRTVFAGKKGIPIIVLMQIQGMPIIHPGPSQMLVVYLEAIGFDEMESAIRISAKSPDVAGVLRYFRTK
tara:strand:- start:144 stop:572 length:429 start_codon:yes stop_codon:yes gene_type:complete